VSTVAIGANILNGSPIMDGRVVKITLSRSYKFSVPNRIDASPEVIDDGTPNNAFGKQ